MVVTMIKSVKNKALILLAFSSAAVHAGPVVSTIKRHPQAALAVAAAVGGATVGALGGSLFTQAFARGKSISFVYHVYTAYARVEYVYDSVAKIGLGHIGFVGNNKQKQFRVENIGSRFTIREELLDGYSVLEELYNQGVAQVFDCTNIHQGLAAINAERIEVAVKGALTHLVTKIMQG